MYIYILTYEGEGSMYIKKEHMFPDNVVRGSMTHLRGCKKVWVTEAENTVRGPRRGDQATEGPNHDHTAGCVKDFI